MADAQRGHPRRASLRRFLLAFAAIAMLGFAVEVIPWVDLRLVAPFLEGIAWTAGKLMRWGGSSAEVAGTIISQPGVFAISIANGCSGLEAVILLGAAILAYPASWRQRAQGLLLGTFAIMALNLVRVISLFYIGQFSRDWFDWAHLYIWDILIMLDGLMVFLLWLRQLPAPAPHAQS